MGKKRAKKAAGPKRSGAGAAGSSRVARKEPYDSDRVLSVVERLREQAMRLSALARAMDDAEVESIVVDGHAMLLRGLNQVDNFTDNATRAVREARTALEHH